MHNLTGCTLVSDCDKTVGLLNGVFSLVKYGLSRCNGGFGTESTPCNEGDFSRAAARLSYSRPYNKNTTTLEVQAENVVRELSTILTSGRLSDVNKRIIKDAYISKLNQTGIVDPAGAALRMAQVRSLCHSLFQDLALILILIFMHSSNCFWQLLSFILPILCRKLGPRG